METLNNSYYKIKEVLKNALATSKERTLILSELNNIFKDMYISGDVPRLIVATITSGLLHYKHSMSSAISKSGLLLTVQNDENFTKNEANLISWMILSNNSLIRQFMVIGFDTLIIKGKNTSSINFRLKEYNELPSQIENQSPSGPSRQSQLYILNQNDKKSSSFYTAVFWVSVFIVILIILDKWIHG